LKMCIEYTEFPKKVLDKFKELWYNKYVIKGASAPKERIIYYYEKH
jgi:hypothetical protein